MNSLDDLIRVCGPEHNDPLLHQLMAEIRLHLEELRILRGQRMQPERERELLEANNRYLERARSAEKDPWVDRCAGIATQHLLMLDRADAPGQRDPLGTSLDHQIWMLQQLAARKVGSGTKSCRWLGWAQAALVMKDLVSLEFCKEMNLAWSKVTPKEQEKEVYLVRLDGSGGQILSAGTFDGQPAMFVEPTDQPQPPGTFAERKGGEVGLKSGSLVFTCSDHNSGSVLLTYALRMLGKLTEKEDYHIDDAIFHGFLPMEDDGVYVANEAQILALMKAARIQGHHDATQGSFQDRNLQAWECEILGDDPTDLDERRNRFGEEAMELLQATGMTAEQAYQLVSYVWNRPVGEPAQEMGGTMVTLAALAAYAGLDMQRCGETELARCRQPEVIAKIRAKRSTRKKVSVLPGIYSET